MRKLLLWYLLPLLGYGQSIKFESLSKTSSSVPNKEKISMPIPTLYWQTPDGVVMYGSWKNDTSHYETILYKAQEQKYEILSSQSPTILVKGSLTWQDKSNNLYVFGGTDGTGFIQNKTLWQWNPQSNQWMAASLSPTPPVRSHGMLWENADMVWIFGGEQMDSTTALAVYYQDLWEYNKSTHVWTQAVSNTLQPTARSRAVIWMDSTQQQLYLYGGFGVSPLTGEKVALDDMWRYDTAHHSWVLVAGSRGNFNFKRTVFDNQRIAQQTGQPLQEEDAGFRVEAVSWQWNSQEVWLWGGQSKNAQTDPLIWRYNHQTGKWKSQIGIYYPEVSSFDKVFVSKPKEAFLLGKAHDSYHGISTVYTIQKTQK